MAQNIAYAYAADITKTERDSNGDLIVYGRAAGPDLDADEQICDPDWLKSAMPDWAEWSNIREMHQPICAGVGMVTEETGDGWSVKSKVLDAGTAKKIDEGGLKGYSVGIKNPRVVRDAKAPGGRIVGGSIVEVSYVDRPANPTAKLMICKAIGGNPTLQPLGKPPTPKDLAEAIAAAIVKHQAVELAPVEVEPAQAPVAPDPAPADPVAPAPAPVAAVEPPEDDAVTKAILKALQQHTAGAVTVDDLRVSIVAYGRERDPDQVALAGLLRSEVARLAKSERVPELSKALLLKTVEVSSGEQKHDPAQLRSVLTGLVTCMKAELDELLAGENELWDLRSLLSIISGFCSWWSSEALGGETTSLFTESDTFMGLNANASQSKSVEPTAAPAPATAPSAPAPSTEAAAAPVPAPAAPTAAAAPAPADPAPVADPVADPPAIEATGDTPPAPVAPVEQGKAVTPSVTPAPAGGDIADLVKSAVADALKPSMERIAALEGDLAKALALPADGGPVVSRTAAQHTLAVNKDAAHAIAQRDELLAKANLATSRVLQDGYRSRAAVLTKAIAGGEAPLSG